VLAAAAAVTTAAALVGTSASAATPTDSSDLRAAVTAENILAHQEEFQAIADANDGNRAAGTSGYEQSADYVAGLLEGAGYGVTRQPFSYDQFVENSEPTFTAGGTTYTAGEDFLTMEYSGSGDVTGQITGVDLVLPPGSAANTSTSGCEASDFTGFPSGDIALIQRGTCSFRDKAVNAANAGAVGAIIFNEGQEGRQDVLNGTLSAPKISIPTIGTSFEIGNDLASSLPSGQIVVDADTVTTETENVIADLPGGRTDRTVVSGAHLDSVPEGPGINDNGSGSATILEIALQIADSGVEPRNHLRFAFWGAEESGLVGSEYYVDQLSKRQIKDIAVNLNFDMVSSANYVRFVYDGDGSDTPTPGPNGSGNVERVFTDYFASQDLASEPTEFSGRSDYGPFIAVGIPAGGLFTGAEGVKTEEQQAVYGGVAGESYDPCYHQPCDSMTPVADGADADLYAALQAEYPGLVGNVNTKALDEMSDAAAHAVLTFGMTTSAVNGTSKASSKSLDSFEFRGSHRQR
jgi:Zn-dependent M28 family amino/carboxypeptidase